MIATPHINPVFLAHEPPRAPEGDEEEQAEKDKQNANNDKRNCEHEATPY